MNTTIRKGKSRFYGDNTFQHGISRSGYFNKRESQELEEYGQTFLALTQGNLLPENEEEIRFVHDMLTSDESSLYAVKLWKKYLEAIEISKSHHSFNNTKVKDNRISDYPSYFAL